MVQMMCTLAVQAAFEREILPNFAAAGGRVDVFWAPTAVIQEKLARGEPTDAVLLTAEAADALVADGTLDGATRIEVVTSRLGVATARGQRRPDLSTPDTFKQALLAARSVAFSRAGASGIYFAGLIERLGIADAVRAKATVIATGFTAEKLLTGEADLAVQQLSELMAVDGIDIAGPFPAALQTIARFSAAVATASTARKAALSFLAVLRSAEAVEAFRRHGLDPA